MGKWEEKSAPGKKLLVFEYDCDSEQDTVTLKMLINNRIKGLVPCSFSQIDDVNVIRFDISSKLRFSDFITRSTTFPIAVDLLISMSRSFIELKKYMIGVEALVLDDYEKMFVDTSVPMAEFVINPLFSEQHRIDYRSFFLNIISNLKLDESGRQYVGDMLSLVNNNFELDRFIDGLEQLKTKSKAGQQSFSQSNSRKSEVTPPRPIPQRHNREVEEVQTVYGPPVIDSTPVINRKEPDDLEPESTGGSIFDRFKRIIKSDDSKPKPKPISKLETKQKPKPRSEQKPKSGSGLMDGFAIPGQDEDVVANYNKPNNGSDGDKPIDKKPSRSQPQQAQEEKMFKVETPKYVEETEYVAPVSRSLSDDDTTQIMNGNMESGHARLIGAGMREVIEIDKDTFFIGRDPKECVDYVINDGRVSRRHASIIRRGDKYYLSDNKSSNHTYLNGKMLTPYDEYEIKTGDLIVFAAAEFTFEV